MPWVYIVRCKDGTFYTGFAVDPQARLDAHNRGRGAKYTSGRRPVTLVYQEACGTKGEALSREHSIKQLTRSGKQQLIAEARRLARRRRRERPIRG